MLLLTVQLRDGSTHVVAVSEIRVTAKSLTIERRGKTYRCSLEASAYWRPSAGFLAAVNLPRQPWVSFALGNLKG